VVFHVKGKTETEEKQGAEWHYFNLGKAKPGENCIMRSFMKMAVFWVVAR
jgi:hypothetical protein